MTTTTSNAHRMDAREANIDAERRASEETPTTLEVRARASVRRRGNRARARERVWLR